jgi:site-specific DNA recombinase
MTAGHERPREEWIEIPVPALVSQDSFARAQELLYENKIRSRRRTIEPSVVQGLVSCQKCGYAFSRTSTRTSARKIHYYKCIGSDGWRKLGGPICDNRRFVRQDLLDEIVWTEVIRLLQDPTLIQQELDRRLTAARSSDPTKKREQNLQRELTHVGKSIERLSCKQALTRRPIGQPSCVWPRPSPHSLDACAVLPKHLVLVNASESYGSW